MARLYCPEESIHGKQIVINQHKQIHYLRDVLRLKVGDDIFVFDGKAHEYRCQIQSLSEKAIRLLIKEECKIKYQRETNLTVACALPKQKSRFDDLVDKLSQLGVNKIIPMITERVIVRWDSNQRQRHRQRWRKIAEASCIQSGRNTLPDIEPVREISQILTCAEPYDLKLIPTLLEKKQNLRDIIFSSSPKNILVLIGPEGDFTEQELTQAKNTGFIPISLGELVLRIDTAAIAIAAFFRLSEAR
jgi:16S rRNA (uracil1498-N3)-methyltransferase